MGNFLNTCETEKVSNYYWLHNLRRWENKIKINNYKINKNTNNPLNYVLNLKNENNELIKRFQKINL